MILAGNPVRRARDRLHPGLHADFLAYAFQLAVDLHGNTTGGTLKAIMIDGGEAAAQVSPLLRKQHPKPCLGQQSCSTHAASPATDHDDIELFPHGRPGLPRQARFNMARASRAIPVDSCTVKGLISSSLIWGKSIAISTL